MSKKSILNREKKREILTKKYLKKRMEIKSNILNKKYSESERWKFVLKLQKFPRDSIKCRMRNRCYMTGRSRGFLRRFGLSRIKFREKAVLGFIPGLKKSSW